MMSSGYEQLLDQLAQIGPSGFGAVHPCENPSSSKAAVEPMPTTIIAACHVGADSHSAICKDPFELGTEPGEVLCKHIYH